MKKETSLSVIQGILRKYWYVTLLLVCAAVGSAFVSLVPPRILQRLIDTCLTGGSAVFLHTNKLFVKFAFLYFAGFAAIGVFDIIKEAVLSIAGQKISAVLRSRMMLKMSRLPASYFTVHESGSTVSRFTNDIETIQALFTNGVVGMAADLLKIAGIVVSMWLFSAPLGIFMLCVLPFVYLLMRFFQRKMLSAQKQKRSIIGRISSYVPETVRNIRIIHAFGKEAYMKNKYADSIHESYNTIEKINMYDSVFSPIVKTICSLIVAGLAVAASARLPFVVISAGVAAACIQYITDVFAPVENIGMELQSIQSAVAGISRVDQFLAEPEESEKDEQAGSRILSQIADGAGVTIELNHVTFSYGKGLGNILDDVSMTIPHGQHVTFTGRTGAGKSTLFRLIPGLLEPQRGSVCINNTDVRIIPNSIKRRIFGFVAQHFDLIDGTVADQITMGDKTITDEQVQTALKFTGMYEYVMSLAHGLKTTAAQNLFSQGQMQLLAVSRAIVTNPPVLLLDEITANLDTATEKQLLSVIENAAAGRTVLSVSHRLSACLRKAKTVHVESGKLEVI